jgi:hypothetical protein
MAISRVESSPLFTPWKDPVSGVESHILSRRVAPLQQSFYFTNPSFTSDGRFLWLYCAFPPGGDAYYGRQLAVVDMERQELRHFPDTQFMDASPFVDVETGEVYWTTGLEIWKRTPFADDAPIRVAAFPEELARNRRPLRIATHLTRSADKKSFAIDAQIGNDWCAGDLALDGSSTFNLWQQFDRCYNHAQFSPTDPDLILIAQDGWHDASTGEKGDTQDRLWLLRRGEAARPIFPGAPSNLRGHEWWDADGVHVWYIHYRNGTEKVNILTGESTLVWPHGHTHSHSDRQAQYLVGDINSSSDTWQVAFYNINSSKEISIVSELPPLPFPRSRYHVHPHPQFCLNDRYICYTTNVLGTVDVALVPVAQLVERTN